MRGFSLVELSIVLVILGLLTGGILAGQSLIRAAELRAVPTEYARYVTAIQSFRDKYFQLPGDFRDATRFWSRMVDNAHCVTHSAAGVVDSGACDGDGNGSIQSASGSTRPGEMHQFWRHLASAGLIEGSYTGMSGSGMSHVLIGTNAPASKLARAGWSIQDLETASGSTTLFDGFYGHSFSFGAQHVSSTSISPVLRPEEAWNIDMKMDDGRPAQGKIVVRMSAVGCAMRPDGTEVESTDLDAVYSLSNTANACAFYLRQAF